MRTNNGRYQRKILRRLFKIGSSCRAHLYGDMRHIFKKLDKF